MRLNTINSKLEAELCYLNRHGNSGASSFPKGVMQVPDHPHFNSMLFVTGFERVQFGYLIGLAGGYFKPY